MPDQNLLSYAKPEESTTSPLASSALSPRPITGGGQSINARRSPQIATLVASGGWQRLVPHEDDQAWVATQLALFRSPAKLLPILRVLAACNEHSRARFLRLTYKLPPSRAVLKVLPGFPECITAPDSVFEDLHLILQRGLTKCNSDRWMSGEDQQYEKKLMLVLEPSLQKEFSAFLEGAAGTSTPPAKKEAARLFALFSKLRDLTFNQGLRGTEGATTQPGKADPPYQRLDFWQQDPPREPKFFLEDSGVADFLKFLHHCIFFIFGIPPYTDVTKISPQKLLDSDFSSRDARSAFRRYRPGQTIDLPEAVAGCRITAEVWKEKADTSPSELYERMLRYSIILEKLVRSVAKEPETSHRKRSMFRYAEGDIIHWELVKQIFPTMFSGISVSQLCFLSSVHPYHRSPKIIEDNDYRAIANVSHYDLAYNCTLIQKVGTASEEIPYHVFEDFRRVKKFKIRFHTKPEKYGLFLSQKFLREEDLFSEETRQVLYGSFFSKFTKRNYYDYVRRSYSTLFLPAEVKEPEEPFTPKLEHAPARRGGNFKRNLSTDPPEYGPYNKFLALVRTKLDELGKDLFHILASDPPAFFDWLRQPSSEANQKEFIDQTLQSLEPEEFFETQDWEQMSLIMVYAEYRDSIRVELAQKEEERKEKEKQLRQEEEKKKDEERVRVSQEAYLNRLNRQKDYQKEVSERIHETLDTETFTYSEGDQEYSLPPPTLPGVKSDFEAWLSVGNSAHKNRRDRSKYCPEPMYNIMTLNKFSSLPKEERTKLYYRFWFYKDGNKIGLKDPDIIFPEPKADEYLTPDELVLLEKLKAESQVQEKPRKGRGRQPDFRKKEKPVKQEIRKWNYAGAVVIKDAAEKSKIKRNWQDRDFMTWVTGTRGILYPGSYVSWGRFLSLEPATQANLYDRYSSCCGR